MTSETFAFQAEINQLLSLIINTFYSNKEVFLRELISNASDALDKVRYESLTNPGVLGETTDLCIKLTPNKESKTLTIEDTGIGMTREDMVKNLGTIAHSGTRAFMESLKEGGKADVSLIGQFGVGFYSAFLVADKVQVFSKHNDDKPHVWESNAHGTFSISEIDEPLTRGTRIILHLKDDQLEYADEQRIRAVVKKHSQYCGFPVRVWAEKEVVVEEPKEAEEKKEGDVTEEDGAPPQPPKTQKVQEWDLLNTQAPIWTRQPEDVKAEEYNAFYKSIASDWEDPLTYKHFSVDGSVQFKSLLYVPKRAPFDMFNLPDRKRNNIKLYVRKVLIMDETNDLLPDYLGFIQGVVDSEDLPLNVSREMLQQNSIMNVIKRNLVKKSIEIMTDLANATDDDGKSKWATFYEAFAKNIKIGVHDDSKNRDKLAQLLQFRSSKSGDDHVRLKTYVERMKEEQKDIYFLAGESIRSLQSSPLLSKMKKKGFEVLFFTDAIDEYMCQALREFEGKKFVNIARDGLDLPMSAEEKEAYEKKKTEWEPVCNKIQNTLVDQTVTSVKIGDNMGETPCVIVADKFGMTANMERIMKAQTINNSMMGMMGVRKVMEINPDHPLIGEIKTRMEEEGNEDAIKNLINLLYETVMLDSGFTLDEPSKYAARIYKLMLAGFVRSQDEEEESKDDSVEEKQETETVDISALSMEEVD